MLYQQVKKVLRNSYVTLTYIPPTSWGGIGGIVCEYNLESLFDAYS